MLDFFTLSYAPKNRAARTDSALCTYFSSGIVTGCFPSKIFGELQTFP